MCVTYKLDAGTPLHPYESRQLPWGRLWPCAGTTGLMKECLHCFHWYGFRKNASNEKVALALIPCHVLTRSSRWTAVQE